MQSEMNQKEIVYLVDTENEGGKRCFEIMKGKMERETVHFLYTDHTPPLSCEVVEQILSHSDKVYLTKCACSTNGLDFQLASLLGFLIATDREAEYIILSNDHGYDVCVDFWNKRGATVRREAWTGSGKEIEKTENTKNDKNTKKTKSTPNSREMRAKEQVEILLKQKGLQGYATDTLTQIMLSAPSEWQNRLSAAFGKEKMNTFFKKTSHKERQNLHKIS